MNSRSFLCFIFSLLLGFNSFGQFKDFEQWTDITVTKILSKKYSILVREEVRFNENATSFDDWLTTVGGHYAFNQNIKIQLLYRYALSKDLEEGNRHSHRISSDLYLRYKHRRVVFRYRIRYQRTYSQYNSSELGHLPIQYLRNRFSIKYDIPKTPLMPYVQYEFYYNLNSMASNTIQVNRFTGGLDYDFNDNISTKVYYCFQKRDALSVKAKNTYILGVSLGYEF